MQSSAPREARPFIASIRDSPDEDGPRLIFADWLDEHGEPARAEFIRVQCELARLPTYSPRYPELHLRQLELVAEHEHDWLGEWAQRLVRWEFRRGLLHSITLTPQPFVTQGEELFLDHPVERVALVNDHGESLEPDAVAETVAARAMGEVRALEIAGCRRDEPMCAMYGGNIYTSDWLLCLSNAEHVIRLEELHLNGDTRMGRGEINLGAWEKFCQARHLRTLRRLDLSDMYRNDRFQDLIEVTRILGHASFVKNLRAISFAHCYIGDEAAHHLAAAPLVKLEDLDLAGCDVLGEEGWHALHSSSCFAQLRGLGQSYTVPLQDLAGSALLNRLHTLRLQGDSRGGSVVGRGDWSSTPGRMVADHEWTTLFRSPVLKNLTRLSVEAYSQIPAEALVGLLDSPWSANLHSLTLRCEKLSIEHLSPLFARTYSCPMPLNSLSLSYYQGIGKALANWPGLAGITDLNLSPWDCQVCEEDATALLQSPHLSLRLERLDLSGCCKSLANVKLLARCPALAGLRWLVFDFNYLNSEAMQSLLLSPYLRHLESIELSTEDNSLITLANSREWPRLRDVVVDSVDNSEGIDALYKRFGPRLRVWVNC